MKVPKLFALLLLPPMRLAREQLARKHERLQSEKRANQATKSLKEKQIVQRIGQVGSSQAIQTTEYELAGLTTNLSIIKRKGAAIVWLFFVFLFLIALFVI
jgi:hypothetical protein